MLAHSPNGCNNQLGQVEAGRPELSIRDSRVEYRKAHIIGYHFVCFPRLDPGLEPMIQFRMLA